MVADHPSPSRAHAGGTGPALTASAAAIISAQIGASIAKGLFPVVGPQGATALRVGFAALILAVAFRPWRSPPARSAWPVVLAYGASLGVMNLLFYTALQRIPLGVAMALEFTGPLGVSVLASRRPSHFVWIVLAAAGLMALLPLWRQGHPLDPVGIAFALGAGVCWGLYILFGQKAGAAHGAQATAAGMLIAAMIAVPVGVVIAGPRLFAPSVMATAAAVAVLSSVLPYTLEMFAMSRIPVRVFGTLMSVEPAMAAVAGFLLLHETLSLRQCLAIAAIMAASVGVTLSMGADNREHAAPPPPN